VQYRVRFDFEIEFTNGGGIQGQDFRLDIDGDDISDRALADHLVSDMRLLMVGAVRILDKRVFAEPHKRTPLPVSPDARGIVDLSHDIENGLVTYKGLPAPLICDFLSRERAQELYGPGVDFQIAKIEMVGNTGTYVDCPFHRFADGEDLAQVATRRFADLDAIVVRAETRGGRAIDVGAFEGRELRGRAVLVHTGWDAHWNTERYFEDGPYLTAGAAAYLARCGVALVGIDAMNIDCLQDLTRPVHTTLLGNGILIAEHLCNLAALPDEGFRFTAAPPKIRGVGTFPVRAYAQLR
jgi:arylformamidase